MSSVTPVESKEFAELAAEHGCSFLDAPVSGGEPGAVDGTLAIMVGGEATVLEKARPVFAAMGKTITLVGPNGSGSVTKLANQVIVNLNIAAVSEALILATKAGADPKKVYEAIRGGLAGSTVLDGDSKGDGAAAHPHGRASADHAQSEGDRPSDGRSQRNRSVL